MAPRVLPLVLLALGGIWTAPSATPLAHVPPRAIAQGSPARGALALETTITSESTAISPVPEAEPPPPPEVGPQDEPTTRDETDAVDPRYATMAPIEFHAPNINEHFTARVYRPDGTIDPEVYQRLRHL